MIKDKHFKKLDNPFIRIIGILKLVLGNKKPKVIFMIIRFKYLYFMHFFFNTFSGHHDEK